MAQYDDIVESASFQADLAALNGALCAALERCGAPMKLNGNLFYSHLQAGFADAPLHPDMEEKRRRFCDIAQRGTRLLEIGVNGGHSLLLAKSANPDLKCGGIDICQQLDPAWARVDVYVPAAMAWLQARFRGDFTFIRGNSLVEAPRFRLENPEEKIDILHVDGDKATYLQDIVNLLPALHGESLIVVDDTNLRLVRRTVRSLIKGGLVRVHPEFEGTGSQRYQNMVLQPI